jgi:hypothetical protein
MQHMLSRPDRRHVFDLDSKGTDLIVEKEQSNVVPTENSIHTEEEGWMS